MADFELGDDGIGVIRSAASRFFIELGRLETKLDSKWITIHCVTATRSARRSAQPRSDH
jgi:hypothetical protein